jgi:hypothetical protein
VVYVLDKILDTEIEKEKELDISPRCKALNIVAVNRKRMKRRIYEGKIPRLKEHDLTYDPGAF